MKLPHLRFTVRRMMVAVAIAGCLVAAFEAGRRWERSHAPAAPLFHYQRVLGYYWRVRQGRTTVPKTAGPAIPGDPVAPDPPEPE